MDCDRVQAALSARMDGERLSSRTAALVERHLATCPTCSAFDRHAWKLRERTRLEPAPRVPDLVDPIMAAVRLEARPEIAPSTRLLPRRMRAPRPLRLPARLAPVAAALVVGLIAGSLVAGGPWRSPRRAMVASAAQVTRGVADAAGRLRAYQARFEITEHHFSPQVPVRELSMSLWFEAPERFRLDVVDHTRYPGRDQTPSDLEVVIDGSAWAATVPSACPVGICPPRTTVIRNRVPFSSATSAPTDLVLPITTLADASQVQVVRRGSVLGRPAILVRLPFERAQPLFPFLSLGGSWRPFYPQDRVDLWLDAANWFPLRYEVFPAPGRDREQWALRFGLLPEPPRTPIFEVRALSVSERPPAPGTFRMPRDPQAEDQGARQVTLTEIRRETGFDPVVPEQVGGLDLYRAVLPASPDDQAPTQAVITYSKGLTWLKVGETHGWTGGRPYGPVGPHAEEVSIPGGGVAYYEPASDDHGRRLSIHGDGTDLYLETNLSRDRLLEVAASLPVVGTRIPESWTLRRAGDGLTERVPPQDAAARVSFPMLLPGATGLPDGFTLASTELVVLGDDTGVTAYYQQTSTDLGIGPIRLHEEPSSALPPASSAAQSQVEVRGQAGRWTPDRSQLEWVEDGVYYSIDAPGLPLQGLLAVADALEPFAVFTPTPSGSATTGSPSVQVSPPGGMEP